MKYKKASWWPFIALIIVIIIFLFIFFLAAYYQPQNKEETQNNTTSQNNECLKYGCPQRSIYIGSKNSDKYYSCSCSWAETINQENIICFSSDEQALNDGRTKSEC